MSDDYLWLEDVDGVAATGWVRDRNAETIAELAAGGTFDELKAEIRQVLDADDRIPYPNRRGDHVYNLWKDAANPRGLWRRTTLDEYRSAEPDWQVLLDVDALAAAEGENWVWGGATVLRPDYHRCLIKLSRGGADAVVVREFDLVDLTFVADGFTLPEAKTNVGWIDLDHIYVGTDFGPGSQTSSGYARVIKRWQRGTPLVDAPTVFEGADSDVVVHADHDPTPGYVRDFVSRRTDFFRSESHLLTVDGTLHRIDVPDDADWDVHRQWLLIRVRSDWTIDGVTHPAGTVLVTGFDDFLAGGRDLTVLFEPDPHTSVSQYAWTRNHLLMVLLRDVKTELLVLTPGPDGWVRAPLPGVPAMDHSGIIDTEPDHDDAYVLSSEGFLQPETLRLGRVGDIAEPVKREPSYFDTQGLAVRQFFATSDDGTRVPYFVVGDPARTAGPTLLTGYGGFEISRTPGYDAVVGRSWLARGGNLVVANIRGGGEYGPQWHHAALRERRPRAYEDFAAVATDLVDRGITEPAQLGASGGSNGGLLMGVMLTRYPELFGAIVIKVPLLDMRRYHLLLAGASWMAEYGDPDNPDDWAFLREFSPYQNVRADQSYPPVLLTTSTRDDRVHPGHARKMTARLAEHGYDVSYYENVEGGHGGAADNEQAAFMSALSYEFLWRKLTGPATTG